MRKSFKVALFGMVGAMSVSVCAYAAEQETPAAPNANPPQVATNPNVPYSAARTPGPKAAPSNWIPSANPTATPTPNSTTESGSYYSKKGFGPAPN
jgi:hypothetical protein